MLIRDMQERFGGFEAFSYVKAVQGNAMPSSLNDVLLIVDEEGPSRRTTRSEYVCDPPQDRIVPVFNGSA